MNVQDYIMRAMELSGDTNKNVAALIQMDRPAGYVDNVLEIAKMIQLECLSIDGINVYTKDGKTLTDKFPTNTIFRIRCNWN